MKVISRREVAGGQEAAALPFRTRARLHANIGDMIVPPPDIVAREWHDYFLGLLHRWSIPVLRVALALIFLWFGALKLFGASPVMKMLEHTYWFLPVRSFALAIGTWEVMVGTGLLFKRALRCALALLCLHLVGTFFALALAPAHFFDGSLLRLTIEGEFVVKNMVLIAAALVIAGHEIKPFRGRAAAVDET